MELSKTFSSSLASVASVDNRCLLIFFFFLSLYQVSNTHSNPPVFLESQHGDTADSTVWKNSAAAKKEKWDWGWLLAAAVDVAAEEFIVVGGFGVEAVAWKQLQRW